MYLSKLDLEQTENIKRLNIVNGITGIKPGNLVGTVSNDKQSNLAIISSVVHLSSNPALVGFFMRPDSDVRRHTFENIQENGFFTINHIQNEHIEQAHYTSAKFEKEQSEFEACNFTEEYFKDFKAPFVKESILKFGLSFVERIPIDSSKTILIVGQIDHLIIPDAAVDHQGHIDLEVAKSVGVSGLNSYYKVQKAATFPYARVSEVPDFYKKNNK